MTRCHKVGRKYINSLFLSSARLVVIVMFMGEYNHTVDTKGRLIIPAKFREALGEEFVVAKGMDGCLFVYSKDEWSLFEKKLIDLPQLTSKESRYFSRYFLSGAAVVELDKQGRILLPSKLREAAALDKDVVLVGVGNRVEIWSKDRWEAVSEGEDLDDIALTLEKLGLSI